MGKDKVHVSLLQFADDTLIFCKFEDAMIENLRKTIALYEWCSSQKVNGEKSTLCGVNMEEDEVSAMASRLNSKMDKLPFIYLGLPLGVIPNKYLFGNRLLTKFIINWINGEVITCQEEEEQRFKSVLSNLPTYYMSSCLMPEKVIQTLERILRNFFLGRT